MLQILLAPMSMEKQCKTCAQQYIYNLTSYPACSKNNEYCKKNLTIQQITCNMRRGKYVSRPEKFNSQENFTRTCKKNKGIHRILDGILKKRPLPSCIHAGWEPAPNLHPCNLGMVRVIIERCIWLVIHRTYVAKLWPSCVVLWPLL